MVSDKRESGHAAFLQLCSCVRLHFPVYGGVVADVAFTSSSRGGLRGAAPLEGQFWSIP